MNRTQALSVLELTGNPNQSEIDEAFRRQKEKFNPEDANPALEREFAKKQQEVEVAYAALCQPITGTEPPQAGMRQAFEDPPARARPAVEGRIVPERQSPEPRTSLERQVLESRPVVEIASRLQALSDSIPEVSKEQLITQIDGVNRWIRKRGNAKLERIFAVIETNLVTSSAPSSRLRGQVIESAANTAYAICSRFDLGVLLLLVGVGVIPTLMLFVKAISFGYFPSAWMELFIGIGFYGGTGLIIWAYLKSRRFPEDLRQLIHPYVCGNLRRAKSVDDINEIRHLLEQSVLFVEEFTANMTIEQDSVNKSTGSSVSKAPDWRGRTHSVSESESRQIGTLNPRQIKKARRMAEYVHQRWHDEGLSDYERDKMLDELHQSLDQATAHDPTEFTRDLLFSGLLSFVKNEATKTAILMALIFAGSWTLAFTINATLEKMGVLAPIMGLLGIIFVAYTKRDWIANRVRDWRSPSVGNSQNG